MYKKKHYPLAGWLFALTLTLISKTTVAYPIGVSVIFTCPCINMLTNSNEQVAGVGTELIFGKNNPVNFESPTSATLPNQFLNYNNAGIDYDSVLGEVTCSYVSSVSTDQPFSLSYSMTNGKGGIMSAKSNNTMSIILSVGIR